MFVRLVVAAWLLLCALPLPAAAQALTGAGSTFAQPVIARWGQLFATLQGDGGASVSADANLDYEPVGSTGGMMRVLQRAVDFGVTDVPMTPEELARHELAQFPVVSSGVAVVTNLPGVPSGALRLSGQVLADIYLGKVARWNDAAIVALNGGLALPDAPIAVLRRADGSGTTYHFAAYLAGASAEWRDRVGVDTLLNWPVGTGARGNRELAEAVRATRHAIGYVEASLAARLDIPVALIGNRAGAFVAPSLQALQAGLAGAQWEAARHFHQAVAAPEGPEAYPIVATAFALVPRRPGRGQRLSIEFFRFALAERSGDAMMLGYVPLPEPVVRDVIAYWRATLRR